MWSELTDRTVVTLTNLKTPFALKIIPSVSQSSPPAVAAGSDPRTALGMDQPDVRDTAETGAFIWVLLFGAIMTLSTVVNLVLTVLVLGNRKKHNFVYFCHLLLFVVNLFDYSVLIFEFSLGVEHIFPYSDVTCTVYQTTAKTIPIVQSWALVILLYHTANKLRESELTCNRNNELIYFGVVVSSLMILAGFVSVPTALFAKIIPNDGKHFCEIDVWQSTQMHQESISIYYLVYSSIIPYWVPLLVSFKTMFTAV